jgi:hypothetical protein
LRFEVSRGQGGYAASGDARPTRSIAPNEANRRSGGHRVSCGLGPKSPFCTNEPNWAGLAPLSLRALRALRALRVSVVKIRTNEANSGRVSSRKRQAAREQRRTSGERGRSPYRETSCETKPICTRGEESVGQAPPYKRAQLRQTNPIRPGRAGQTGILGGNVRNKAKGR